MQKYSRLLFDRGNETRRGRPNLNDLLFINTSFFNFFLPILLTVVMRWVPQANHLVFGQLEGQDPIYSTLLIGVVTVFHMLIYMRQTYFYDAPIDRSTAFKLVNQTAFLMPLSIWMLAITFNYPMAHLRSILISVVLISLVSIAITRSPRNFFRPVQKEPKINRLILVFMIFSLMIFLFFLIQFGELAGKEKLPLWVLTFILLTILTTGLVREYSRRRNKEGDFRWTSLFQNSTANAIYILAFAALVIRFFGNYNKFGNAFDVLILFFLGLRIILFCLGVLIRYFANSSDINVFTFKFWAILGVCYFLGLITRPHKGREQYRIDPGYSIHQRMDWDSYVDAWMGRDTTSVEPIYLISGQGGGSRAGCAFFTSMTLLDSMLGKNLLLITAVSGSANGTGFYLGIKHALPAGKTFNQLISSKDTTTLRKIDSILYQKDYISSSLFKLLFTDYSRSVFGRINSDKSRNMALLKEEDASYREVAAFLKLKSSSLVDSTWGNIYTDSADHELPLFFPMSYNIERGVKAIHSPVHLPSEGMHPFWSVLDSLRPSRDLTISQSILTSQLFPIINASASIDSFHYLDGGVYDNLAFESLFDFYRLVAAKRDLLVPHRPIILISIVNGQYEKTLKPGDIHTELGAIGTALSGSLFSTNPKVHKSEGLLEINKSLDRFFELKIFTESVTRQHLSLWQKIWNIFIYVPNKDQVIVSRYLTMKDIDKNIIHNAYREIDTFKTKLSDFLYHPQ
ncbi:MAG: hypothetical protein WBB12_18840 [Saprospiraceae bacterium]|nr:hypothetical protein [Saprospiraceae bacterium]